MDSDHLVDTFRTLLHDPKAEPELRNATLVMLSRHGHGGQLGYDLSQMLLSPSDYTFASGTLESLLADKSLKGLSTSDQEQIREILEQLR